MKLKLCPIVYIQSDIKLHYRFKILQSMQKFTLINFNIFTNDINKLQCNNLLVLMKQSPALFCLQRPLFYYMVKNVSLLSFRIKTNDEVFQFFLNPATSSIFYIQSQIKKSVNDFPQKKTSLLHLVVCNIVRP